MPFRTLATYVFMARRCGWYATRQHMLKKGYSYANLARVLVCFLRLQGAAFYSEKISTN